MAGRVLALMAAALAPAAAQVVLHEPAAFEENRGQAPAEVRFLWRGGAFDDDLLFTAGSVFWSLREVELRFVGADPAARAAGEGRVAGVLNVLRGAPAEWKLDVPRYAALGYRGLYPGMDLAFRPDAPSRRMHWILTARPGANIGAFRIRMPGIGAAPRVEPNGVWYTGGKFAVFLLPHPQGFQERAGLRTPVPMAFRVEDGDTLVLEPGAYDPALPLEIAGWFGSVPAHYGFTGGAFMLQGPDGSYHWTGSAGSDIWVGKWDPAGEPRWITILSGSAEEQPNQSMAVSGSGDVFLAGGTRSADLPVGAGAAQPDPGPVFVTRLGGDTGLPRAGTYFGTEGDAPGQLALDGDDAFFTSGARAVKWDSGANRFVYVSPLDFAPTAIAVNAAGELYLAGPAAGGSARIDFGALRADGSALRPLAFEAPRFEPGDTVAVRSMAADTAGRAWVASTAGPMSGPLNLAVTAIHPGAGRTSTAWIASAVSDSRLAADASGRVWLSAWAGYGLRATPGALQGGACGHSVLLARFEGEPLPGYLTWFPAADDIGIRANGTPFLLTRETLGSGAVRVTAAPLDLTPPAAPRIACAVNAAQHGYSGALAPGELAAVVGAGFGPTLPMWAQPDAGGRYPTELGGVRVRFNGVPAPILSLSYGEALVEVPPAALRPPWPGAVELETADGGSTSLETPTAVSVFAFFSADGSGYGQAAALNQDGTVNSRRNPAPPGTVVSLFGTGGGEVAAGGGAAPFVVPVIAAVGGIEAPVEYAGAAPGLPGVNQVNLRLPDSLASVAAGVAIHFGQRGPLFIWPAAHVTVAIGP